MKSTGKRLTRVVALFTAAFIAAGALFGCGGKSNGDDSGNAGTAGNNGNAGNAGTTANTGRYVERLTELGFETDRLINAFADNDGNLVFYAYATDSSDENGNYISRCVLSPDGSLDVTYPPVLTELARAGNSINNLSEAPDGSLLILYIDMTDYAYKLARSTDGVGYDSIEVPGWTALGLSRNVDGALHFGDETDETDETEPLDETGEDGDVTTPTDDSADGPTQAVGGGFAGASYSFGEGDTILYPNSVVALDDGFLVTYMMIGVKQYDYNGVLLHEYDGVGSKIGMAVYGGRLAVMDAYGNEVLIYDMSTGKLAETIPFDPPSSSGSGLTTAFGMISSGLNTGVVLGYDAQGLFAGDSTGIYRYADGAWVMIVDGELSSFIMSDRAISYLFSGDDGDFRAILGDMDIELMHYVFDPDMPAVPDTVLEIFTLHDNSTVRQAIGQFQRQNPNVKVSLRVAMDEDSGATLEDVVRALNTEILAGKGPDLIVLDGLPIDSYIEKGVLKDITSLLNRAVSSDGLLENMSRTYERDGKLYGAPSRFSVPIMLGQKTDLDLLNSLSDLRAQVEDRQGGDPSFLRADGSSVWSSEGVLMDYYDACADDIMTDGVIDQSALASYFADMLAIDAALKENTPESQAGIFMVTAMSRSGGGGGAEIINMGADDLAGGNALVHLQTLNGVLGLMNISRLLADIDGMALSSMFNDGKYYPVGGVGILSSGTHQDLAEDFLTLLLSRSVQDKYLYDGFPVNAASLQSMLDEYLEIYDEPLDDMGFADLCKALDSPVFVNEIVKEAAQAQFYSLQEGAATPEQAAKNVVDKTWLYLAE